VDKNDFIHVDFIQAGKERNKVVNKWQERFAK
jgi:hypothetical protein